MKLTANIENVSVSHRGSHYLVVILEDYVLKIPRDPEKDNYEVREAISEKSLYLSKRHPEILPCYNYLDFLLMKKAPGVLAEESKTDWSYLYKKFKELQSRLNKSGYVVYDISPGDLYYDKSTDTVYPVDLHQLSVLPKKHSK